MALDTLNMQFTYQIHPERQQPYEDLHTQRTKLDEGLRERGYFPTSIHPGDVFIAESAGLPLDKVGQREALSKTGWREFMGMSQQSKPILVFRKYSREQQAVIDKYWDLLSPEVRF